MCPAAAYGRHTGGIREAYERHTGGIREARRSTNQGVRVHGGLLIVVWVWVWGVHEGGAVLGLLV